MEISFNKSTKLSQIQTDFQKRFNYLKIEFFKPKKEEKAGYTASDVLNNWLRIEEVSSGIDSTPVLINGSMKVGEVEKIISEKLGLHVQIFRKSGKVWLITSSTDHLSLDELDKEARERDTIPRTTHEESDYHEQE